MRGVLRASEEASVAEVAEQVVGGKGHILRTFQRHC